MTIFARFEDENIKIKGAVFEARRRFLYGSFKTKSLEDKGEHEMTEIYDTTLRDGAQTENISFSVRDKLKIAWRLKEFGIPFVEGGWPSANPKDTEFFQKAVATDLKDVLVAFGSTFHPKSRNAGDDKGLKALILSGAKAVAIFGKTWDFHVSDALRIPLEENLRIIFESVKFLKSRLEKVFFDAEHFFDGYKANPGYALECLKAAERAGADTIILCDTNGGALPAEVESVFRDIKRVGVSVALGIHAHNDCELAVANSLAAVKAGAIQVQGTINGLGERCGNANLVSIIPTLELKLGEKCLPPEKLNELRETSLFISEVANVAHSKRQAYVGDSAFAHKAGMHVSAVNRNPETYEHINPASVGNKRRILVSDLSGRSNILRKAGEIGMKLEEKSPRVQAILDEIKSLENQGYAFEAADASFELLVKKAFGFYQPFFELVSSRIVNSKNGGLSRNEATVMLRVGEREEHTAGKGDGPINAVDEALRKALERYYPILKKVRLVDYKVTVLSEIEGTSAKVRVLIESESDGERWTTIGVSTDVIEASRQALIDGIEYFLLKKDVKALI